MSGAHGTPTQLFDRSGRRKYLTGEERALFRAAALAQPARDATLCLTLHYTGCRLSEALALTTEQIDQGEGLIVLRSLKKRRDNVFRAVPVPDDLIDRITALNSAAGSAIWDHSRTTGWRRVKQVLNMADINGTHANPRGLRHGFGVAASLSGVPITLIQRWMGHARLETTSIYLNVVGVEERTLASRLWQSDAPEDRF